MESGARRAPRLGWGPRRRSASLPGAPLFQRDCGERPAQAAPLRPQTWVEVVDGCRADYLVLRTSSHTAVQNVARLPAREAKRGPRPLLWASCGTAVRCGAVRCDASASARPCLGCPREELRMEALARPVLPNWAASSPGSGSPAFARSAANSGCFFCDLPSLGLHLHTHPGTLGGRPRGLPKHCSHAATGL